MKVLIAAEILEAAIRDGYRIPAGTVSSSVPEGAKIARVAYDPASRHLCLTLDDPGRGLADVIVTTDP